MGGRCDYSPPGAEDHNNPAACKMCMYGFVTALSAYTSDAYCSVFEFERLYVVRHSYR